MQHLQFSDPVVACFPAAETLRRPSGRRPVNRGASNVTAALRQQIRISQARLLRRRSSPFFWLR